MGSYLATPVTDKKSEDGVGRGGIRFGASAMQGWRVSQEDAHLALLNYDSDGMLYAVFDGHGGAEVAKYAAQRLGDHIRSLEKFKEGKYEEALEEGFLSFDAQLKEPHVQEVLRAIAKSDDSDDETNVSDGAGGEGEWEDEDDEEAEDLGDLLDEADVPLRELVSRYSADEFKEFINKRIDLGEVLRETARSLREDDSDEEEGGGESGSEASSHADTEILSDTESQDSSVSGTDSKETSFTTAADLLKKEEKVVGQPVKLDHLLDSEAVGEELVTESHVDKRMNGPILGVNVLKDSNTSPSNEANQVSSSTDDKTSTEKSQTCPWPPVVPSSSRPVRSRIIDDDAPSSSGSSSGAGPSSGRVMEDSEENEADTGDEDYKPTKEEEESEDEDVDDHKSGARRSLFSGGGGGGLFDFADGGHTPVSGYDSGATACLALIKNDILYVANVGDSRCVLSDNGEAVDMSSDHKPEDPVETKRINRAGGKVTADGRVNNGLNLSRALGDHNYKRNETLDLAEQMISAKPDLQKIPVKNSFDFMIIACDGIWNSLSSQAAVDFVKTRLTQHESNLSKICEEMFDSVLAKNSGGDGTGMDNMTCIIVKFPRTADPTPLNNGNGSHAETETVDTSLSNGSQKRPATDGNDERNGEAVKKLKVEPVENMVGLNSVT